jgi:hypothetical protein
MLQGLLVARFALRKRVATDHVQRVTKRQLGTAQRPELGGVGMQFSAWQREPAAYQAVYHIFTEWAGGGHV